MSIPTVLPAVTGKLDTLLYFQLGLQLRDRQPLRISGQHYYRLVPEPVDQVMVHLTLSNPIFLPTAYSPALICFGR
jgi:hypothetical protein